MGKQNQKQFSLDNKRNCCIYLCRIISSCELCMDKFKRYNAETKAVLENHSGSETIKADVYSDLCDKTYNVMDYLLNLLGDGQSSSISYFKYRKQIQKRINKGNMNIQLYDIHADTAELIGEFNKMRNWQNHVPESLLVAEMEQVDTGIMEFPMDPVEITHYHSVTYKYFEHLYLSNVEFYDNARKIIQMAKKDYSMLMGRSISYPRVYADMPLGFEKSVSTKQSARIQGLKGEKE